MRITKIYNNNVVSAVDDRGHEVVLAGAGVGFSTKRGSEVDASRVEKRFVLAESDDIGLRQVLVELPAEAFGLIAKISLHVREQHGVSLPPAVEVALIDHISASLTRLSEGVQVSNSLLWETRATYPEEFRIALEIVGVVDDHSGQRLPIDEAGFIAMHLANAGLELGSGQALAIAETLRRVGDIVEEETGIPPRFDSAAYARFVTHLKFVIHRLAEGTTFSGGFDGLIEAQQRADPTSWRCAQHIAEHLTDSFQTKISDEELLYLTIHLTRLRREVQNS